MTATNDDELGVLEPGQDGQHVLRFTRRLSHPPEKVWRAITEPEHLAKWFPSDIEGERAAGAKLTFPFREDEGPTLDGEMLAFDPPSLMELRWGDELLRFELTADDGGTTLVFTNVFDELGKASRDAAGWHTCLELLEADLDGTAPLKDRWRHFEPIYKERFGPEASTIGPPEGHPNA